MFKRRKRELSGIVLVSRCINTLRTVNYRY